MSTSNVAMSGITNQERAYIFAGWSKTEVLLLEASSRNILILFFFMVGTTMDFLILFYF